MTTFKEQMVVDLQVFFNLDEFAVTVMYEDGVAAPVAVPALVSFDSERAGARISTADHAVIRVKRADVPNPQYRQVFVIEGRRFVIAKDSRQDAVVPVDPLTWEIRITADERATSWRT